MNELEALAKMIPPGQVRPNKPQSKGGVLQVWITRACDLCCFGCTQASNVIGPRTGFMTVEQFRTAVRSLRGYFGTIGVFGGNPAIHPRFEEICAVMREEVPYEQRGLWCNHPRGKGKTMRQTFNPRRCNLNVHLVQEAYDEFKEDWPECNPFGLYGDCRHSPPFVAMKDVIDDEEERWDLIVDCDINKYWSAMICVFRGELRGFFCEVAGAQSMLHQDEEDYPDTGIPIVCPKCSGELTTKGPEYRPLCPGCGNQVWWRKPMEDFYFTVQARKHCNECSVPLRGYGELACAENGVEQTSKTHAAVYRPKKRDRQVQIVTTLKELQSQALRFTDYVGGGKK